jgi:hypothetical protein
VAGVLENAPEIWVSADLCAVGFARIFIDEECLFDEGGFPGDTNVKAED